MVVHNSETELSRILMSVLSGQANSMSAIRVESQSSLLLASHELTEPMSVTREAVIAVVQGLLQGDIDPATCQTWASFVMRGYVAGTKGEPVAPLHIDFDGPWEDSISAAVSRLDELGDSVDGTISRSEALRIIESLT